MKNKVRGIRNNNPANIRRGSSWKGLVPFLVDPTNNQRYYDKSFCQFESMEFGVRALIVLLRTYVYKYKLNSVKLILHRFAPLSENNTYAYIANVCLWMSEMYRDENNLFEFHLDENWILNFFHNPKTPSFACRCLCKSICMQESGFVLTDEMLDKAIAIL